ncbi:hypothetical protein CGZ80_04295 [Rhodopirellula sp. MGV]|nr:hypothetical protein CGZ80_04295 [Rhodopirellula sp. MGV]
MRFDDNKRQLRCRIARKRSVIWENRCLPLFWKHLIRYLQNLLAEEVAIPSVANWDRLGLGERKAGEGRLEKVFDRNPGIE